MMHCTFWHRFCILKRWLQVKKHATYGAGLLPIIWEKSALVQKECCIILEDSSIICRGIACWKVHLILSKENCKRMANASLQAGKASLMYLILHLEQECNRLNSCYMLQKHISPAKEGCTSFEGNPVFLRITRDILQGIVERFMQLYQWYEGANIFQYIYSWIVCILKWSFTFWLWCIYYIAFHKGNTIHKVTLKQKIWIHMALHGDCMELDYIQELLNKHLTFWFVDIFCT